MEIWWYRSETERFEAGVLWVVGSFPNHCATLPCSQSVLYLIEVPFFRAMRRNQNGTVMKKRWAGVESADS